MNNSNGAALLARVKAGDLVTVRRRDGGQSTGIAEYRATGLYARTGPLFSQPIMESNIISIRPRD